MENCYFQTKERVVSGEENKSDRDRDFRSLCSLEVLILSGRMG